MPPAYGAAVDRVRLARHDDSLVVLEGVHAVKHALRFGAHIELTLTSDRHAVDALLAQLAPDVRLPTPTVEVDADQWLRALDGRELGSPLVAVAHRPSYRLEEMTHGHVVVLEQPRHTGNVGATIRVAAAAEATGLVVIGGVDPWHPSCVRGAAGLQFALPVVRVAALDAPALPLIAIDPDGVDLTHASLPDDALLAFGTERSGLSRPLRESAEATVRIPMRDGVSSINLATAVAVTLYTGHLASRENDRGPVPGQRADH